ncbi:MAG: hypothetical protein Q8R29_02605 [bacterium]|nr:hypothetical protein [bacterium]
MTISVHVDEEIGEYFFSTKHFQCSSPERFIPVTHSLPHEVRPRPGLTDGVVRTKRDVVVIYYYDMKEVPNPDPKFQA